MGLSMITIHGIEAAYRNLHDASIFDDISLPEGIDKQLLTERIFVNAGEFSLMHTDPDYFHWQTLSFFRSHYRTFEEWWKVMNIEYNPIENYNRKELTKEDQEHEDHDTGASQDVSETKNMKTTVGDITNTQTKSAFNSNSYEPYERNKQDTYDTTTNGKVQNDSEGTSDNEGEYHLIRDSVISGNIGVTTSQQMIQSSIDLYKFNVYEEIAKLYTDEFCIKVY